MRQGTNVRHNRSQAINQNLWKVHQREYWLQVYFVFVYFYLSCFHAHVRLNKTTRLLFFKAAVKSKSTAADSVMKTLDKCNVVHNNRNVQMLYSFLFRISRPYLQSSSAEERKSYILSELNQGIKRRWRWMLTGFWHHPTVMLQESCQHAGASSCNKLQDTVKSIKNIL